MSSPLHPQVLVVGAGPAGATTAIGLARRGLGVVVLDSEPSTDFDVLLSAPALRQLHALRAAPPATPVVRMHLQLENDGPGRVVEELGAATAPLHVLRTHLAQVLLGLGVPVLPLEVVAVTGATGSAVVTALDRAGAIVTIRPGHLVVATGKIAGIDNRAATPPRATATARRYRTTRPGDTTLLSIPPPAPLDYTSSPTSVWVVPGDDASVTVGAMSTTCSEPATLQALAVDVARRWLPGLDRNDVLGELVYGRVDATFSREHLSSSSGLVVGAAAGLVNPFTAEGISYAVQSGAMAAEAIAAHPSRADLAQSAYVAAAVNKFVGYFETARHAARRQHLTWRLLAAAARSEHPFLNRARRAVLQPEGFSADDDELVEVEEDDRPVVDLFLAACDEVAISVVRTDWPFLARLAAGEHVTRGRIRPSLLLLTGLLAAGTAPDIEHARLGAALDLTMLGMLAFQGEVGGTDPSGRGVDWARATTVLAGDFLLAQASRLVADAYPSLTSSFADWLSELAAHRAARLSHGPTPAAAGLGALFEFPARIGAQLSGAGAGTAASLSQYGTRCGEAFAYAEDVLSLTGRRPRLDTSTANLIASRLTPLSDLVAQQPSPAEATRMLPDLVSGCRAAWQEATLLANLTEDRACRDMMQRLATSIARPALGPLHPP